MAGTLVKTLAMHIVADPGDSRAVLADLNAQGEELSKPHDFVLTASTAQAQAGIDEATRALDAYLDATLRTAEAQAELEAKQAGGTASDAELAAAHDKVTQATLAQLDASIKLTAAEERQSVASKASADTQVASAAKTNEAAAAADGAGAKFGRFGLVAGAALVAVGYESTKLAVGFQADMEMIHTQAGVAQSAIPGLSQGVLQLAGQVGEKPGSLADALYHIESSFASTGITGAKALDLLKVSAQGAVTGHADLVDVTNALDAAVASGIPGVQNYGQAMGTLNAIVGSGDMKMQDLADAMGTGFLSNVKIYGSTLTDVGAILATFGDNNIRGAHAGTQLRMSVQSISVQAKTAAPVLHELGLKVGELGQYQAIHGTVATINLLVERMKAAGVSSKDEGQLITDLFGKKAGAGVAILVDQVDRLNSKVPDMEKGAKSFGASAAAAYATPAVKLKQLQAGTEAAGTSLGLVLLPALMHVLGPMVSFLNWVDSSKVKMEVFAGVVGVLAGTVLIGKLGGALRGGVNEFQALGGMVKTAAEKLGILTVAQEGQTVATEEATVAQGGLDVAMSANPIGLIIIGIVALIAVIVLVVTHLKDFEKWGKDAFHFVEVAAMDVFHWVKSNWPLLAGILLGPVALAVGEVITHFKQVKNGAMDVVHFIENSFKELLNLDGTLRSAGIKLVMGLVNGIESVAMAPVHAVESIVSDVRNLLPFSPAKKGPLSGGGSPDIAGRKFATMFAGGIESAAGAASSAASRMAGGASAASAGSGSRGAGGAGGGDTYNFNIPEFSDPATTAQKLQTMLRDLKRRNGGANLGLT